MSESDFISAYASFEASLRSFIYRMVAHHQDTQDLQQEAFLKALQKLDTFREESSVKTWVFAIAANLTKDYLRKKKRWTEDYQDNCRTATLSSQQIQAEMGQIVMTSPQGAFDLKEHIDYCFTCMTKTLPVEQQVCLMLKEVYQFSVKEVMEITALSEGKVKHALADARKTMVAIFDRQCTLVSKKGMCHQCSELSGMLNPKADAQAEQNALKMKQAAEKGTLPEALLDLRMELIQGIDPIEGVGFELHNYMIESLPEHSGDAD